MASEKRAQPCNSICKTSHISIGTMLSMLRMYSNTQDIL